MCKNAQKWLDNKYPPKQRKKLTSLDIRSKSLMGSLKLEGFINLEKLNCQDNLITDLEIISCPNLKEIDCS